MVYTPGPQLLLKLLLASRHNPFHAADGKFASGSGAGGSASELDDGQPETYLGGQPGKHGLGVDPKGVSYTEHDLDENTGEPKFSQAYRDKYGPITSTHGVGETDYHVVTTESGGIHVADDAHGAVRREVVQEFTKKQASSLSDDINTINDHGGSRTNAATGVHIKGDNHASLDGLYGAEITWANGSSLHLNSDATGELQEGLWMAGGMA